MSNEFTCPGGIIGAILADSVKDGSASPEVVARVAAEQKEWDDAGLVRGQWAARLSDGRLVAANSPEHVADQRVFLSQFTTTDGKTILDQ